MTTTDLHREVRRKNFLNRGHSLQHREPAIGYASRLAALAGVDLPKLMRDMRINTVELARGEAKALRDLGALRSLEQADMVALAHYSPRRPVGDRVSSIGRERLLPLSVMCSSMRICPHCVAEDLESFDGRISARPWLRLEWMIDHVRSCRIHGTMLQDAIAPAPLHVGFDFSQTVSAQILPSLDRLRAEAVTAPGIAFEDWIVSRLDGVVDRENWLDDVPLRAGIAFCEAIGFSSLHPPKARPTSRGTSDLARAAEEGFRLASKGLDAVETMLDRIVGTHLRNKTGSVGHERIYGQVHVVLRRNMDDPAFDKFRHILREHAFRSLPISPGTVFLGVELKGRRVHTQRSAAVSCARTDLSMRRLWASTSGQHGVADADARVRISVERFETLVATLESHMTTKEVSAYTGLDIRQIDRLADAGVLPSLPAEERRAGLYHRFLRTDVIAFVDRLFQDAVPTSEPRGRRVSVAVAQSLVRVPASEILAQIYAGRLAWVGWMGIGRRYENLLVDADEARAVLRPPVPCLGLSNAQAIDLLPGVNPRSLSRFAAAGILKTIREYRPESLRTVKVFTRESVAAFAATYVSIGEIATALGVPPVVAVKRLSSDGLKEAIGFETFQTKLYLRDQTAAYLAPATAIASEG